MYIPKLFKMDDHAEIFDFIRQNSFGILINADNDVPVATHIPIELEFTDENEPILRGHVSKVNPHALLFEKNPQALVIFTGAHTYVSSSWYVQENVSTWNYTAVHVYGQIRVLSEDELLESVEKLTKKYESGVEKPLYVSDMSPEMVRKQIKGITGFELKIEDIQAKAKLSQNRTDVDYKNVVEKLEKTPDFQAKEVARLMRQVRKFE